MAPGSAWKNSRARCPASVSANWRAWPRAKGGPRVTADLTLQGNSGHEGRPEAVQFGGIHIGNRPALQAAARPVNHRVAGLMRVGEPAHWPLTAWHDEDVDHVRIVP